MQSTKYLLIFSVLCFVPAKCKGHFADMNSDDGRVANNLYKDDDLEFTRGYDLLDSAVLKSAASMANYILDDIIQPKHSAFFYRRFGVGRRKSI